MRFSHLLAGVFLTAVTLSTALRAELNPLDADPFAGKFSDAEVTLELIPQAERYTGSILKNGRTFRVVASRSGESLSGTFEADGNQFAFVATVIGDRLSFNSGTKIFTLVKDSGNPLDILENASAPAPAPGLHEGPATPVAHTPPGIPPAGYTVVNESAFGQALAAQKRGINSVQSALQSTTPDLSRCFDGRVTILTAYQDTKDPSSGGATFAAKLKGQPVKGWITCKVFDQGAVVIVIHCRADAPASEWSRLISTPGGPQGNPPGNAGADNPPQIRLREHRFPDNTGSVGVAAGWKTDAQTGMAAVTIDGPAGQQVMLGYYLTIVTPESQTIQTHRALIENARQTGAPPPQLAPLLVAPFTGPADALVNLMPQLNHLAQQATGTQIELDNVVELKQVAPILQGGRASILTYGVTWTTRSSKAHYKVLARVECDPVAHDSWMLSTTSVRAPDATFDRDLPTMLAMATSVRENAQVIGQKSNENIDAMNQRFAAQQQAHRELMDTYARSNRNWEKNNRDRDVQNRRWEEGQNRQSHSVADFDEVIRGYRTVEDTRTGEKTSVNLGHVDQIVDKLNEYEPDRYRQIPLRDE